MNEPLRFAVMASGSGSNFEALLRAAREGRLDAEPAVLITNRPGAGALEHAERYGVPSAVLRPADFPDEAAYTAALLQELSRQEANFIVLAGYLMKIPEEVVRRFQHRILNVHPALLPAFGGKGYYGRRVHEAALEHGVRWSGATVHLVDAEYDTGPIVLQQPVPVLEDDTPESLAGRVLEAEHRILPEALQLFATGRVRVSGRRVFIHPEHAPNPPL
jgi:formyltetrahydrofolate-dependent phosphoribosylglycinamide formyltransferase